MTVDYTREGFRRVRGLLYVLRATFLERPELGTGPRSDSRPV